MWVHWPRMSGKVLLHHSRGPPWDGSDAIPRTKGDVSTRILRAAPEVSGGSDRNVTLSVCQESSVAPLSKIGAYAAMCRADRTAGATESAFEGPHNTPASYSRSNERRGFIHVSKPMSVMIQPAHGQSLGGPALSTVPPTFAGLPAMP